MILDTLGYNVLANSLGDSFYLYELILFSGASCVQTVTTTPREFAARAINETDQRGRLDT